MPSSFLNLVVEWIKQKGVSLLSAAAVLLLGLILSRCFTSLAKKFTVRSKFSASVQELLLPFVRWGTLLIALLISAGMLMTHVLNVPTEWFTAAAMTILRAVAVFSVGCAAINLVLRFLRRLLATTRVDPTIQPFLCHAAQAGLYVVLVIGCVDILGIPTASVVAAIASAGVALSLSVKDHLSNLIGGLVVLVTKPFSKGDYIELDGSDGVVEEIGLIYTVLRTYDARRVYVPNNDAARAKIINHSAEPIRRLDMTFSIGYRDDFARAQELILQTAAQTGLVLPDPAPLVRMNAYGINSIEIVCRLWTTFGDLYELKYQMAERVKAAFDDAGISIPYQQIDLHLVK